MADMGGTACFSQLTGQQRAKKLIRRALGSGRIPHAFLFKGPEGVGKRHFAMAVAAVINCRNTTGGEACGDCPSCRKFRSGSHPDFMIVSPEKGAIRIEQVRRMSQALSYPPYESPTRVVLIEDVHGMRTEAANSLLKTLEEPPPDNLLILTADSSKEILPTICSRCQLIPFSSLTYEETVEVLLAIDTTVDAETALLLARLAEGCPGKALLYRKTGMTALLKDLTALLGKPSFDIEREVGMVLDVAERMSELKDSLPWLFGLLRMWVRDRLMHASGLNERVFSSGGDRDAEGVGVKNWSSRRLFGTLEAIAAAERQLARNCNRTLVCEVLLFSVCSLNTTNAGMAYS